jgi:hypothetical protein
MTDGNTLHGFARVFSALRGQTMQPEGFIPDAYSAPVEAPRDPLHGSDEAKLRAVAADLVRRRRSDASALGDIFIKALQEELRK